tara:strand:+ start:74 stop:271 length:198 start_codon:yes stop_codon:yes gene_type:complete
MSRLFRDWSERCETDFDNLSDKEKQEWIDFCMQVEINDILYAQVDRIFEKLYGEDSEATHNKKET